MIAIGGSIGAGLFVGSGSALAKGGPASLVLDFAIIGVVCCLWLIKDPRFREKANIDINR